MGLILMVAMIVIASAWPASAAADGDPASDVLVSQPIFLPLTSRSGARIREGFPRIGRLGEAEGCLSTYRRAERSLRRVF